ncbi:MAG: sulfite exporter TauE/SafE family protein [Desulfobulbus sp.]|nr:sulfite exporter TauE/SafE family protein [Desulfobulbus sp.]
MIDTLTVLLISATFLLAGSVKGVIGLGLPTVSLGLLAATLDLTTAMALLLIPSFITNIWQATVGGDGKIILQRIWPFLCLATITIWLGSTALTVINPLYLSILLGLLLLAYSVLNLLGFRFSIPPKHEQWSGLLLGTANGILTGMTGSFVVPGVMYLQAIGLPRDMLVQAMGMLFSLSTIGLAFALKKNNLLTYELATISALAVVPSILGMVIGQKIRKSLSENKFRRIFFISILILGAFIIIKSLFYLTK